MGILKTLQKKVFGLARPRAASGENRRTMNYGAYGTRRMALRRFDAAQNRRNTQKHWANNATNSDADTEAETARPTIRQRARYEIRNNSYAKGMVDTYATDTVGPDGPALVMQSGNDAYDTALRRFFSDWAEVCDYGGRMSLADILYLVFTEQFRSGEAFIQLVSDMNAETPCILRLLPIEADRIMTPTELLTDPDVRDGIRVDATSGRVIEYYVLKQHPGYGRGFVAPNRANFEVIPARDMLHVYDIERPGQTRGTPWLAPCLDLFAQLRDYTEETIMAARAGACLAAFMYTDHPEVAPEELGKNLPVDDIEPLTVSTLPQGWKMDWGKPEQPTTQYASFRRETLSEIGRCVGMPYNIIAANSAGYNYSSSKMDCQIYGRDVSNSRRWAQKAILIPIFRLVANELRFGGYLQESSAVDPENLYRHEWFWQPFEHADPSREASGLATLMGEQVISYPEACAQRGRDFRRVIDENAMAQEYAAIKKVALNLGKKGSPTPAQPTDENAGGGNVNGNDEGDGNNNADETGRDAA